MAKFDLETKEYTITSSAEAPAERGSWPHTLRVDPKDPEGYIWYTDAGRNSVFRQHPETLERKEYHLLDSNQVKAGGKGESRGITPYGLDYSPVDGTIWYSKLNGNRIGRIDPTTPDGAVTEWNPPFRGPRRLHVAPDGIVWVPGFGSGVFGKFDPKTEKWTTYPLPDYLKPDSLRTQRRARRHSLDLWHWERHSLPFQSRDRVSRRVSIALSCQLHSRDRVRQGGECLDQHQWSSTAHGKCLRHSHQVGNSR